MSRVVTSHLLREKAGVESLSDRLALARADLSHVVGAVRLFDPEAIVGPPGSYHGATKALKRKGISYKHLAEKLNQIGVPENEPNIRNNLARGRFTAAFLVQVMSAIGSSEIRLQPVLAFLFDDSIPCKPSMSEVAADVSPAG